MSPTETNLWDRIRQFALDDPDHALPFSRRLARENGWTRGFTQRVLEEYRRFLFLCCVTSEGVTPSDAVDQAWHLHLTYTKSYWHDLCRDTLGREIHHHPTRGGEAEGEKFHRYYDTTQEQYRHHFGEAPPADIWPYAEQRFSEIHFRRVNRQRNWIVPKPKFVSLFPFLLLAGAGFFMAASHVDSIVFGSLVAGLIVFALVRNARERASPQGRKSARGDSGGGCGSGCFSGAGHSGDRDGGDSGCSSGCSGCGGGD